MNEYKLNKMKLEKLIQTYKAKLELAEIENNISDIAYYEYQILREESHQRELYN